MRRSAVARLAFRLPLGALVLLLATPPLAAKRPPEHEVVEAADGDLLHLTWKDDPAAQAWVYRPKVDATEEPEPDAGGAVPAAKPMDLVVALHGAGGDPKTLFLQRVMDRRKAWCLSVAGHSTVQTDQGPGFMWDGANTEYVIAFTQYLLGKYLLGKNPLEKSRVIVWGHSAGGTMTLETLARAPAGLYAGGLTTAAPATPTGAHKDLRVCVFLGTADPNWGGAGTVRAHLENLEKKRSKGACAFFAVQGLGHNVPDEDYLDLGFDWVLAGEARGGEASVPQRCQGREGDWRHVLVRYKGAEGAPSDLKRTKSGAEKVLKEVLKDIEKGRAFFPFEAACHSDDAATAGGGGGIGEAALKAIVGEIPALEPGQVSPILETPQGLDLVFRPGP